MVKRTSSVDRYLRGIGIAVPKRRRGAIGRSPGTMVADAVWRAAGIMPPVRELRVCDQRLWRFDFAWPRYMVAVEVDGGVFTRGRHVRGAGFVRDQEKRNRALADGWLVLSYTPQTINYAQIREVLRGRAA